MELPTLASWLPQTKLTPPQLRGDLVPRPRLQQIVQQTVMEHALTLVAAPAGYGKTTTLAVFAHRPTPIPVLWLALDAQDDDPRLLLAGLIAAFRHRYPACCQSAEARLAHHTLAVEQVAGCFVNDLIALLDRPTVLVLDDLHLLRDPAIYALLTYLVEHLPPQLHLIIATRHDPPLPLARWQARGLLARLQLAALSFSSAETSALLNDTLGLGLTPAELTLLQQRTEGWVAGLRLLAGSLSESPGTGNRASLLPQLAQGNRSVTGVLLEEVLNRQEPAVRSFLLATSILEELSPLVCAAVTGREDAEALLDALYRRNLFLVALHPGAAPSYRYHALFADFLRQELARETTPDELRALHHLAAAAEPVAARAIQHALAAQAWELAIQRIEQVGGQLVRRGLRRTFESWVATLPTRLAEACPRLSYLRGVCAWQRGDADEAETWLQRAASGFAALGDLTGQGEALVDLGVPLLWRGDLAQARAISRQSLALPLLPRSRLHAEFNLFAISVFGRGRREPTDPQIRALIAMARSIDDPEVLTTVMAGSHPLAATCLDALDALAGFYRQALKQTEGHVSPPRAATLAAQAAISLMRGQLEEALRLGHLAQAVSTQVGGYPFIDAPLAFVLARVHIAAGRYAEAERELRRGLDEVPRLPMVDLHLAVQLYLYGRLHWLRGNTPSLREVHTRMLANVHVDEQPGEPLARALTDALLALAEGRLDDAQQILAAVVAREDEVGILVFYGSARPLLAHLALLRGRPAEALAVLTPWLADCERHDTPGRILFEGAYVHPLLRLAMAHGLHAAFVARTLALLEAHSATHNAQRERGADRVASPALRSSAPKFHRLEEPLTPRELEVLRLLATGATNRAIAERLVIGTQTAKTHVARILGKLGAATRTEAVARAIALGLIPSV